MCRYLYVYSLCQTKRAINRVLEFGKNICDYHSLSLLNSRLRLLNVTLLRERDGRERESSRESLSLAQIMYKVVCQRERQPMGSEYYSEGGDRGGGRVRHTQL